MKAITYRGTTQPDCPLCESKHWVKWFDPPGAWLCRLHGDVIKQKPAPTRDDP